MYYTHVLYENKIRSVVRDDNSGTDTRYPSGTQPDGYEYGDNFLHAGGIRIRLESFETGTRRLFFFLLTGNPTGTRYFTTVIILCCEQVKMYSFCYINYDLF
jgi:hypothetical protein